MPYSEIDMDQARKIDEVRFLVGFTSCLVGWLDGGLLGSHILSQAMAS